jgi:hypothetical protein
MVGVIFMDAQCPFPPPPGGGGVPEPRPPYVITGARILTGTKQGPTQVSYSACQMGPTVSSSERQMGPTVSYSACQMRPTVSFGCRGCGFGEPTLCEQSASSTSNGCEGPEHFLGSKAVLFWRSKQDQLSYSAVQIGPTAPWVSVA